MSIATSTDNGNEYQPSINTCSTIYTSSAIYNAYPKQWSQPCRPIELQEILSATDNFDKSLVIGRGGFGNVYKGNLVIGSSTIVAAVKRLDSFSNQGATEFRAEVDTLSTLRHNHIVPLIGYCDYRNQRVLVYEYMPNGTLYDHLHHKRGSSLSWLQRLRICIETARALDYLHTGTGTEFGIIHRDVKSSNILLDTSWEPKISDFGLSKRVPKDQKLADDVYTAVLGTFGYADPSYVATGKLTRKSDVYSFGVVLLEVLCRKSPIDTSFNDEHVNIVRWAQDSIKDGRLKHIIDSDIRDEISTNSLKGFVRIAGRCLDNDPEHRPTMAEVVSTLEFVLNLEDNLLQPARRRVFGRQSNTFSSIPFFSYFVCITM